MTEQEITQYLVKKYQPHALLLHGSRVAGVAVTPETDWDILCITKPDLEVNSETYQGQYLDVAAIPASQKSYLAGATPILPMRVLYDDALRLGQQLIENNQAIFDQGPAPLSAQEISNRRNILNRIILRLEKRQNNPVVSLIHKGDIAERACRYWCELRQIWPQNEYRLTPLFEQEDPAFYKLLVSLGSPEAVQAARAIHAQLFGDLK